MAKKFVHLLFGVIIVCLAIAGCVAFLNKYKRKNETSDNDSEAFTDEDITEDTTEREYVTIPA